MNLRQEWEEFQDSQGTTVDTVWRSAAAAAAAAAIRIERQLGHGNVGPWTDFEWGMITGKLSALRWALGAGRWALGAGRWALGAGQRLGHA
ncbi:hypothetical protein EJO66_30370 [Variovorax beijingensis]|uniref:Uncharacterized protein n=1 Tax=Variovorax beijingensis TaxID=2496117 RepID=A0ABX9ZXG9_9BURK|nr:hypothetical protein EJO66_30370 [Variovorax beijingensis]